jgi:hypothetical protein
METIIASRYSFCNSLKHIPVTIACCYKSGMDNKQIRLENLKILVTENRTIAAVAKLADTAEAYLSQILNSVPLPSGKTRGVGDELARKLESGCGKPVGWMDQRHDETGLAPRDADFLSKVEQDIVQYEVPDHIKEAILTLLTSSPPRKKDNP